MTLWNALHSNYYLTNLVYFFRFEHCIVALDDGKVMIIGGAYGGFNSDVIIYHGSSSTFTVAPDMLFENYGTACSLFYSKKHNSRPVVFVVYGKNAQLFDYTVTDSWEESKNFSWGFLLRQ